MEQKIKDKISQMKKSQDQAKAEDEVKPEEKSEAKEQEASYAVLHDEALFRRELLLRFDYLNSTLVELLKTVKGEDKPTEVTPKK